VAFKKPSKPVCSSSRIALIHDDIRCVNFTTKPHFENTNYRFYHGQIPNAAEIKIIPS